MMIDALLPREDYVSLNEAIYLNQASLGLVGQPAVEAMHIFLDTVGRHGNMHMSDEDEVAYFANLRERGAKLLHSNPSQVAILGGASELLGQLPYLLVPQNGRKILALSSDFPALTRPWLHYSASHDCPIHFVDDVPNQSLTDNLIGVLDDKTAVCIISTVQFATGTKVDIKRLREATLAVGTLLIVDATQAAGAIPVDTASWGADVVVTSGYKWLGGHGGAALGVFSKALLEKNPPLPGWMGAPDPFNFEATKLKFANDARRYTQSTMSYLSLAGLTVAIDQLLAVGISQIEQHAKALSEQLLRRVEPLGWQSFHKMGSSDGAHHIVSLAHPEINVEEAVARLRLAGVVCGSRNGRVRISIAPYNNNSDIDTFIEFLQQLNKSKSN